MDKLSDNQQKTMRRLGIRKSARLIRLSLKLYNRLCPACKKLAIENSGDFDADVFCKECKLQCNDLIKKIEGIGR